jgi:hypothetical protein
MRQRSALLNITYRYPLTGAEGSVPRSWLASEDEKRYKPNPTEIINSGASSRCQSPSHLLNKGKVEVQDVFPFVLNAGAECWMKVDQKYYKSRVDTACFPVPSETLRSA